MDILVLNEGSLTANLGTNFIVRKTGSREERNLLTTGNRVHHINCGNTSLNHLLGVLTLEGVNGLTLHSHIVNNLESNSPEYRGNLQQGQQVRDQWEYQNHWTGDPTSQWRWACGAHHQWIRRGFASCRYRRYLRKFGRRHVYRKFRGLDPFWVDRLRGGHWQFRHIYR